MTLYWSGHRVLEVSGYRTDEIGPLVRFRVEGDTRHRWDFTDMLEVTDR